MPTAASADHRVEGLDHHVLLAPQAVHGQAEALLAPAHDHRVGLVARRPRHAEELGEVHERDDAVADAQRVAPVDAGRPRSLGKRRLSTTAPEGSA